MEKVAQVLQDCDCIYISGGNTFFLMQELRRTGTDKLIVEQVEKGKPCIGESAGAMIFSPNIEYAKDMDDHLLNTSNFVDFTGLGIVDFYPVVHFNSNHHIKRGSLYLARFLSRIALSYTRLIISRSASKASLLSSDMSMATRVP